MIFCNNACLLRCAQHLIKEFHKSLCIIVLVLFFSTILSGIKGLKQTDDLFGYVEVTDKIKLSS